MDRTLCPLIPGGYASSSGFFRACRHDDTGRAWKSDLPSNYVWGSRNYPTATELWGAVAPDNYNTQYAYTIARVPYADMTQMQAAMP